MHISLQAEKIFEIAGWPINNSLLASLAASVVIILLFGLGARWAVSRPNSRLGQMIVALVEFLLGTIEGVTHNRRKAERFLPLLTTLFSFILLANWMGLLPGVGSILINTQEGSVPLFRGANADLNTTLALALISVVMTQVYAVRELGIVTHLKKYFSTNPILSFVGVLEILGEFSKMISFSFRLFGNIFAGEVLLVVISSLAPILGPLPFFGLELFVGLVQALVFTMLSLVFLEIASSDHSGHEANQSSDHTPKVSDKTKLTEGVVHG